MSVYTSFLVRCWLKEHCAASEATYLVEQVQTGAQLRSHRIEEIWAWVAQVNAQTAEHPPVEEPEA